MVCQELQEVQQKAVQSPTPEEEQLQTPIYARGLTAGKQLSGKAPGDPGNLGCIRRSFNHTSRDMILPLFSVLARLPLEQHIQFWHPQHKMELLETAQRRATKMM